MVIEIAVSHRQTFASTRRTLSRPLCFAKSINPSSPTDDSPGAGRLQRHRSFLSSPPDLRLLGIPLPLSPLRTFRREPLAAVCGKVFGAASLRGPLVADCWVRAGGCRPNELCNNCQGGAPSWHTTLGLLHVCDLSPLYTGDACRPPPMSDGAYANEPVL